LGSSLRTACFGALLAISGGAANAQQIVETSTGKHAEAPCSISEAMLAAIEDAEANRDADARARLDSLLQTALAGTRTRPSGDSPAHSPVVFPPVRPGS
jgi:hypothetical protein